jgi:hypothetical protein
MEICIAGGKKLEETIFSVLEPYLDLWHHVYQDNYYDSVEIAEKLLLRKTRVCGTIRASRGIPKSLADSSKKTNKGRYQLSWKGNVLLHIWKDKREVSMSSTTYV